MFEQKVNGIELDIFLTNYCKKKEVTGERSRLPENYTFFFISEDGKIQEYIENGYPCNDHSYAIGNYYSTREQAQAVADLRRHVYKFPAIDGGEDHWWYGSRGDWDKSNNGGMSAFSIFWLPITATKQDREARAILIKKCLELNGYVSI